MGQSYHLYLHQLIFNDTFNWDFQDIYSLGRIKRYSGATLGSYEAYL